MDTAVTIKLSAEGQLSVVNMAEPVAPEKFAVLTSRFERGATVANGSGLGLAIVLAIAEGADGTLTLHSPPDGQSIGFEAVVVFPATTGAVQ